MGRSYNIHLANAAGAAPGDGKNVYESLAAKSFHYNLGHWKKALSENKGKHMFCQDYACNANHKVVIAPFLGS